MNGFPCAALVETFTDSLKEDVSLLADNALLAESSLEQIRTLEYAKIYCKEKADSLSDENMHASAVGVSEAMNVIDTMIDVRIGVLDEQLKTISDLCGNIREDLKRYNQG